MSENKQYLSLTYLNLGSIYSFLGKYIFIYLQILVIQMH